MSSFFLFLLFLLLRLQQVAYLGKQLHLVTYGRLWSRSLSLLLLFFGGLHFSDNIGHNAYQEEYREGYYQKVDNRLQECPVVERNGGSSIGLLFERNAQIL